MKVDVLIADSVAQRWVDKRYGPGIVVLDGTLQPIRYAGPPREGDREV